MRFLQQLTTSTTMYYDVTRLKLFTQALAQYKKNHSKSLILQHCQRRRHFWWIFKHCVICKALNTEKILTFHVVPHGLIPFHSHCVMFDSFGCHGTLFASGFQFFFDGNYRRRKWNTFEVKLIYVLWNVLFWWDWPFLLASSTFGLGLVAAASSWSSSGRLSETDCFGDLPPEDAKKKKKTKFLSL